MNRGFSLKRAMIFLVEVMALSLTVFVFLWGVNMSVISKYDYPKFNDFDPGSYSSGVFDFCKTQLLFSDTSQIVAQKIVLDKPNLLEGNTSKITNHYLFLVDRTGSTKDEDNKYLSPREKETIAKIKNGIYEALSKVDNIDIDLIKVFDLSDLISFYSAYRLSKSNSDSKSMFALGVYNNVDDFKLKSFRGSSESTNWISLLDRRNIVDSLYRHLGVKKKSGMTDLHRMFEKTKTDFMSDFKTNFSNNEDRLSVFIFTDFFHDVGDDLEDVLESIDELAEEPSINSIKLFKFNYLVSLSNNNGETIKMVNGFIDRFEEDFQMSGVDYGQSSVTEIAKYPARFLDVFMQDVLLNDASNLNLFYPNKDRSGNKTISGYFEFKQLVNKDTNCCYVNFKSPNYSRLGGDIKLRTRSISTGNISKVDSFTSGKNKTYGVYTTNSAEFNLDKSLIRLNRSKPTHVDMANSVVEMSLVNVNPKSVYQDFYFTVSHDGFREVFPIRVKQQLLKSHAQATIIALHILYWVVSNLILLVIIGCFWRKIFKYSKLRIIFFWTSFLVIFHFITLYGLHSYSTPTDLFFDNFINLMVFILNFIIYIRVTWLTYRENKSRVLTVK